MPAACSTQKAKKKYPVTVPSTDTTNDGVSTPAYSNNEHCPSTKRPAAKAKKGLNPVVKNKKADECEGKARQAPKARQLNAQANATMPTPPRCTLPDWPGQNIHPAGQFEKKSQHSKEQIEAEHKAELKALQEKINTIQMAKEHFINMNIEEELEEDRLLICLSTKIHKRHWDDVEADSNECFDLREADDSLDSDELSETDKATETNKNSQAKKHVKHVICQELVTRVQELHGAKLVDGSERQQKLTGGNSSVAHPFNFGGLCDDDLYDVHPVLVEANGPSCGNELVRIGVKSEDTQPGKPCTKCKAAKSKVPKATAKGAVYNRQESVNLQPFPGACLNITEQCLANLHWTHIFLLTLNHYLYLSKRPFAHWTFESDTILLTIQTVFNLTFMNISYTLSLQDAVVKAAYNQMKTQRSKIASDVL
ncbi:hypothetical protein EI94DRAFT_1798913 [Lactarius quietus]|nr:hypothetical protein EI94DRAFT_1798913 [Lactarius quietus]